MPNRLAAASSPYLIQHADNPVDWLEWGEEAFRRAKELDRPILLSVGYASCHWCHVMAHESFEDPATAEVQNRLFVNVKVDREERPDVDRIYMDAVQAMTGRGGWPMTVFLTPEGKPFYAGTYFPKEPRHGLPSFVRLMESVAEAWSARRGEVVDQADRLAEAAGRQVGPSPEPPDLDSLGKAYQSLRGDFDRVNGGFGGAPKFPQAPVLELLLRIAGEPWAPDALPMVSTTLGSMAKGGIYDHLGGGFARYSVDPAWLVPHFEKMLYDNAQLARLYLRAWQETGEAQLRTVATETLEYLLRDLRHPDGGFFSAEDADSEGVEGKFYVFEYQEFQDLAGEDALLAGDYFRVTPQGNFEGHNILHEARSYEEVAERLGAETEEVRLAVARAKERLREARNRRVRPGLDDKVVTAWNGLALRAFAEAGAVLDEPNYLQAARDNARFLLNALRRPDGRLMRAWRDGRTGQVPGFCDDYAALAVGLFALYQATGELEWYREARLLTTQMIDLFADPSDGGFFTTGRDGEQLFSRPKDLMDNPAPSGNSLAAEAILILSLYTGDADLDHPLYGAFRQGGKLVDAYPSAVGHLLAVLHTALSSPKEVAIVGRREDPATDALTAVVWERFRPDCVLATDPGDGSSAEEIPLLEGRAAANGQPLAYVCQDFACRAPVSQPVELRAQL